MGYLLTFSKKLITYEVKVRNMAAHPFVKELLAISHIHPMLQTLFQKYKEPCRTSSDIRNGKQRT